MPRVVATVAVLLLVTGVTAQPAARRATNLAALLNYPAFYQMRPIVLVGTLAMRDNGRIQVTDETGTLQVIYKGTPPDGLAEVRGEFWDVGRMNADDPRLTTMDVRSTFGIDPEAPWPRPGQVLAVVASAITSITPPGTPSVRTMVLFPTRYREQKITVVGQFAGRNLLGDLPDAPGRSRYDFVLRSADAAVWVTNLRPRGKDFELALDARIDTGRWLEVTGTLQQGRGLQWLDAEAGSLKLAKAPSDQPEETIVRVPAAPPPEVIFSAPTEGETRCCPWHQHSDSVLSGYQTRHLERSHQGIVRGRHGRRGHANHRLHDRVSRRGAGARTEVRQAARAISRRARVIRRGRPRDRSTALESVDAGIRSGR